MSSYDALGFARASIDFCERNFEVSPWVAEPLNTLSSLPLAAVGLFGLCAVDRNAPSDSPAWERRAFATAYAILAVIGVGSAALHATLTAEGQAADEAPMLLLNLVFLFVLAQIERERGPWLARAFCAVGLGAVAVYLRFQAFYGSFLAIYISSVVGTIAGCGRLALRRSADGVREEARLRLVRPLFLVAIAAYALLGSTAWLLEMGYCDAVSASMLGPAFLHPLWHCGAGTGTWLCVQLLSAARIASRGARPELRWRCGLPVAAYPGAPKKD